MNPDSREETSIAIIGLAGRYPGAADVEAFWRNLQSGVESVRVFSRREMVAAGVPEAVAAGASWVGAGAALDDPELFDASFFGMSPREARATDPQQRIFLECAWEALESAGYDPARMHGRVGVFGGCSINTYLLSSRRLAADLAADPFAGLMGADKDFLTTRVSYKLDLRGPSVTLQTACSTSLVAVHFACQSLLNGECDTALAGGVSVRFPRGTGYLYQEGGILSPDGHCRAFDARGQGTVGGEGVGMVVLKRLTQAREDGDCIRAIIRGSAVNNDGSLKIGYTAPGVEGQVAVIEEALAVAEVEPDSLGMLEAHGTGTALGDPIEITALTEAWRKQTDRTQFCALGSVKTNIGHLDAAAGVASLTKAVLAVEHGIIPPSLHFERPNPQIDFASSPFYVSTEAAPWRSPGPRRAAVSSFGVGGTNAHVILEEVPPSPAPVRSRPRHLLCLSARDPRALNELTAGYAAYLRDADPTRIADICFTASVGRSHFAHRRAFAAATLEELRASLEARHTPPTRAPSRGRVAFLFTGEIAPGAGRALYETQAVFRGALERCDAVLAPILGRSIISSLYSQGAGADASATLGAARYQQPMVLAVAHALTELWTSWGIRAEAVAGHGVGEHAAAVASGVLAIEDALRLVAERGRSLDERAAHGATAARGATMDSRLPEMERAAARVALALPRIPFVSAITGEALTEEVTTAAHWARNGRDAPRFTAALETLARLGMTHVIEIGPTSVLTSPDGRAAAPSATPLCLPSLLRGRDDWEVVLHTMGALYEAGADVDWRAFAEPDGGRRLPLPTYPFQRQRYGVDDARARHVLFTRGESADAAPASLASDTDPRASLPPLPRAPALLGRRLLSALDEIQFQIELGVETLPFLADHVIFGRVVVPAACYLTMALAAAREVWGGGELVLEDVQLQRPLVLADARARTVQLIVAPNATEDRAGTFRLFGLDDPHASVWTLHTAGKLRCNGQAHDLGRADLAALRTRCPDELSGHDFFRQHLDNDLVRLGSSFRWLERIFRGDGEALGRLRAPADVERIDAGGAPLLHPGLIDSSFQALGAILVGRGEAAHAYVPIGLDRMRACDGAAAAAWCHVRVVRGLGAQAFSADVRLLAEDGQVVAHLEGLHIKGTARDALLADAPERGADVFYEVAWARAEAQPAQPLTGSTWLVLGDLRGVGRALAQRIEEAGVTVRLASPSENGDRDVAALLSDAARVAGVVYLGCLDAPALDPVQPSAAPTALLTHGAEVLRLVGALVAQGSRARLVVATRRARPVRGERIESDGLAQAAVWGLLRTVAAEHPELRPLAVDLDPTHDPAAASADLLAEVTAASDEPEVARRDGERLVPRLRRSTRMARHDRDAAVRLVITAPGRLDDLEVVPAQRRAPGPTEVEIRVHATGLNFRDVMNALGALPGPPSPLGLECAGTVERCGERVEHVAPGDVVIAMAAESFATFVTVPADFVARKPTALSSEEAATIAGAFATAAYGLETLAQIRPGERILIHAAAGGVGMAALQIARLAGLEIFATAGRPEKREALEALGVQHVYDSRNLDFSDAILAATGGAGVDVVLSSLTGDAARATLRTLRRGGRYLELGKSPEWSRAHVAAIRDDVSYVPFDLAQLAAEAPRAVRDLLAALVARFERGELSPLPCTVFPLAEASRAFRFMAAARHIGKVVVRARDDDDAPLPVRGDGLYLVTGGLGDLGLHVARFLVDAGARHLALVGRSAPSPTAREVVAALEGAGAEVHVYSADVASATAVEELVARLGQLPVPLRGVVHAAGVIDDGVLLHQDEARLRAVLAGKAVGAWNLHGATLDRALDFFVLFSSATSILAAGGQGTYAAANEVLDALAHHRRGHGRPAVSINWGAWSTGMASRVAARGARGRGLPAIEPTAGVAALGRILRGSPPQIAVLPIDLPGLTTALPAGAMPAVLSELAAEGPARRRPRPADDARARALLATLRAAAPPRRHKLLVQHVGREVGSVLGLAEGAAVDAQQPLGELGLDSLLALELRTSLAASLACTLPLTLLFDYPTVDALARFLDERLFGRAPEAAPSEAERSGDLEGLSVDEVAALLAAELDAGRASKERKA